MKVGEPDDVIVQVATAEGQLTVNATDCVVPDTKLTGSETDTLFPCEIVGDELAEPKLKSN